MQALPPDLCALTASYLRHSYFNFGYAKEGDYFQTLAGNATHITREQSENLMKTFRNGVLHSVHGDSAVSMTQYDAHGCPYIYKWWYQYGVLHREGAPADIRTQDGRTTYEGWYVNGRLHREGNAPAVIMIYADVIKKEWWQNGALQRSRRESVPEYVEFWSGERKL